MGTVQRVLLLSLMLAVYASAFTLPLYERPPFHRDFGFFATRGEEIYFSGWEGFAVVPLASHGRFSFCAEGFFYLLAWLANPCLWVGCVQFARGRYAEAARWGYAATLLALLGMLCVVVLKIKWIIFAEPGYLLSAYLVWLTSMVLLAVAASICRSEARQAIRRLRSSALFAIVILALFSSLFLLPRKTLELPGQTIASGPASFVRDLPPPNVPHQAPAQPKRAEFPRRRQPPPDALSPRLLRAPTWQERHRVEGGPESIRCLTYSGDGSALAWVAGSAVKLLDAATGKERPSVHHTHEVRALALSPDGKVLATGTESSELAKPPELQLWDTSSGKLLHTLKGHVGPAVRAVAFGADGKLLASGGDDGYIRLWDPRTGRKRAAWRAHARAVNTLTFNQDGKLLTSWGQESEQKHPVPKAWDVNLGKETILKLKPGGRFRELVYLADGRTGIAWQYNGRTLFWDTTTGECLDEFAWGLRPGYSLVVRSDRKQLATADVDGVVRLWEPGPPGARFWLADATKVRAAAKAQLGWAATPLTPQRISLAFTPDHQMLITTWGTEAHLYDLDTGQLRAALKGHERAILALAVSPDSKTLATGASDGTLRLWQLPTGQPLGTLGQPHGEVQGLAFSRDGRTLAAGYVCRPKLKPEDEDKRPYPSSGIEHFAHAIGTLSRLNLYRSLPGEIKLWDVAGRNVRATLTGHARGVSFVAFLGGTDAVLSVSDEDLSVRLWGAGRQAVVLTKDIRRDGPLAVSADGRTIALGGQVFDLTAEPLGAPRARVSFGMPEGSRVPTESVLALSPDGRTLAGMVGHLVKLCDTTSGATLAVFRGHRERTNPLAPSASQAVAFSADGRLLASADGEGVVRLWNVAAITER
jgi:WD40 repeat protein